MIRRPPRSTQSRSSAASDVYKRQALSERSESKGRRKGGKGGLLEPGRVDDFVGAGGWRCVGVADHGAAADDFDHPVVDRAPGLAGLDRCLRLHLADVIAGLAVGRDLVAVAADRFRARVVGGQGQFLVLAVATVSYTHLRAHET